MLKYSPKVFLIFKLPDGSTKQGFFRPSQRLGDIVSALWPKGKTEFDQEQNIGQLGLKNDTLIEIKDNPGPKSHWPFRK